MIDKNTDKKQSTGRLVEKNKSPQNNDAMVIIGIGASAGGLEALRALITNLPVQRDITYVIAQHLDPKHSSMLATILERDTDIPVVEVKHNETLKPQTLYIIPPGKHAYLKKNKILLESATGVGPKPSVDRFFLSLAEEKGEQAVGIVLSGTGTDGAYGIHAIKSEGGITIAQEESTAKFPSMPHASIITGHVDLILAPEKIGGQLAELIRYPRLIPAGDQIRDTDYLSRIFRLIQDQTGGDFSDYKLATIQRRIERRMAVHRLTHIADYVTLLESQPEEIEALHQDILISVTDFFRDTSAFKALNENLKNIVANASDNIRIWTAGCATGEEAYSIAILLAEHLGNRINRIQVQIFATDLDDKALVRARQGFYPRAAIVKIEKKLLDKYFIQHGDTWQLNSTIRDMILFARHDLVKAPPFSHIDFISCRNVLIYFNHALQERVLQTFHYALNENGMLFLGKSETTSAADTLFFQIDAPQRLYQKRAGVVSRLPFFPNLSPSSRDREKSKASSNGFASSREKKLQPGDILDKLLLDVFQADCVLLNQHHEVVYVRGDVSPYLQLGQGLVELNICDLAKSEYRHDLRGLIYKAKRKDETAYSRQFKTTIDGKVYKLRFICRQFNDTSNPYGLLLIFEKNLLEEQEIFSLDDSDISNQQILALKEELRETKESLQTTIEELETSHEELQSTYEEAQSTNEELYTSTEELQTSNEELQSTNEELRTVNQEINVKSTELVSVNDRLKLLNQQLETEIEERKLAELKLAQQEKKLRMIIQSEPAWVNVCDKNGLILEVNPAGIAIMEAESDSQLVGKRLPDFVSPEFVTTVRACIDGLSPGETEKHEIEVKTLKGNTRWLEVSTVMLPDVEKDDAHIMSIICDQTQYKIAHDKLISRQEELSHVMRLNTLGAMASGLAHELNQPLSAINNYLNGCERRVKSRSCNEKEVLEALHLASLQAQRAGDIINHVKNFVKQGKLEIDQVNLNEIIQNSIHFMHATGQSNNLSYNLKLSENLPNIMIPAIQVEQVLINIIRNGVEAMKEANIKKPEFVITTKLNKKRKTVKVSIQDIGNGISQKMQESIFKPFQTTKEDGMGMGLCISRSIVENYGGYFDVGNAKNGGAIFSFELPISGEES